MLVLIKVKIDHPDLTEKCMKQIKEKGIQEVCAMNILRD